VAFRDRRRCIHPEHAARTLMETLVSPRVASVSFTGVPDGPRSSPVTTSAPTPSASLYPSNVIPGPTGTSAIPHRTPRAIDREGACGPER
jgi:hypothetical protein